MNLHNSLLIYTRKSDRPLWNRIILTPVTLVKSTVMAVQVFVYVLWSECVEGESVVRAEWNKR